MIEENTQTEGTESVETERQAAGGEQVEQPEPKAKRTRKPKAKTQAKGKSAPAAKKAATPSVELYGFRSKWSGPSDVTNKNVSRTQIDPACFGQYPQANVTQRDQDAIVALRAQFAGRQFERRNCDAGILRRLMERGLARHVSGDPNAASGRFALTRAGLGQPTKKAANG